MRILHSVHPSVRPAHLQSTLEITLLIGFLPSFQDTFITMKTQPEKFCGKTVAMVTVYQF